MTDRDPITLPAAVAAAFLLGALAPWPYGYFVVLRWVVGVAALMMAFRAHDVKRLWATWTFGFVTLLFNPLIPIHLTRELWAPIDLLTAVLFGVAIVGLRKPAGGGAPSQRRESRNRAHKSETRHTTDGANYVRRGLDLATKLQSNSKGGRKHKRA